MIDETLRRRVEQLAYEAESRAVATIMRSGRTPRVGEIVDYTVDWAPGAANRFSKRKSTYRFPVEIWHLQAAAELLSRRALR